MSTFAFYSTLVFFLVLCVFFALLILIQKGRGGGISAAFGGAGGNTAFGSKTGDVLTWATSIVFAIFLASAVVLNLLAHRVNEAYEKGETSVVAPGNPAEPGAPLATPTGAPAGAQPHTDVPTQPTTGPMSVVPVQDRNPQGIAEPAATQPTLLPPPGPSTRP